MRSPLKVVWSEGMLLAPQHLQLLDRAHEALVDARVKAVAAHDWGVVALEFDEAALTVGEVRILRFAGVLPDGLPVAFDEARGGPPARAPGARFPATSRSLDVYLAVPRERDGVPSFAEEGSPSGRYVIRAETLADTTAPGAAMEVRTGLPNMVLLLGDEPRQDHESVKVAEVVRTSSGQLALDRSYVPPCLRIGASPWILGGLRELLENLVSAHRALAATQRNRQAAADMTAVDVRRLLQLLVLGTHIPGIAQFVETGDASPGECYGTLAQLAGQLCAFPGDDPAGIPRFNHVDLRATLEPLFARIKELLRPVGVAGYEVVPLEKRAGGIFVGRLEERLLRARLFLMVGGDQPEARIAELVPTRCKITALSRLVGLQRSALPGLEVEAVHRPPPQLPLKQGMVYFELIRRGPHWEQIAAERILSLFVPPPFDPARTQLELYAIAGAQDGS